MGDMQRLQLFQITVCVCLSKCVAGIAHYGHRKVSSFLAPYEHDVNVV
jgi:hypothetical protein